MTRRLTQIEPPSGRRECVRDGLESELRRNEKSSRASRIQSLAGVFNVIKLG